MTAPLEITDVRLTLGNAHQQSTGLLGWIRCEVNRAIVLDGLTLRRTAAGQLAVSYPERRDAEGRGHPYVRPVNDEVRAFLERQIVATARTRGVAL